jgi:enolase-phosphatase E1
MIKAVLLDIEGTTTPIAFVHEVLFSYARLRVRDYLTTYADSSEVQADLAKLMAEHKSDVEQGLDPPPLVTTPGETAVNSEAGYIVWLIDRDRKSPGLKSLQGKIWKDGYLQGELKSQVFADVPPALSRWRERGITVNIFSSGSVLAQQLLFAHTELGDLTSFINAYFDTGVGAKSDADTYRRIANNLQLPAESILFISDVVTELDAAHEAGMEAILSVRPGNHPQPATNYRVIKGLEDV